jgi:Na+(H+)/acetate symporter ActP
LILIFCLIGYPQDLQALPIGFCRCLKLMGMHNITHYFEVVDMQFKRKSTNSWMKFSQMMYFLILFVHVMASVWLLTNRLDPETGTAGWYKMNSLDTIPHPVW